MGKAVILENKSEGRYLIEQRYNSAAITARLVTINQALVANAQQRVETQAKLDAAFIHMRVLNDALNGVLSSTTLTAAEKDKQSRERVTAQQAHRLVLLGHQSMLGSLAATRTHLLLEFLRLDKVPRTRTRTVWSADYAPDLGIAGIEVGTIEVPGEELEVLLYPAKNQFRPWTPTIDGDLTPVAAQSPMAWLYNTCMVTGWQTYRPTFRFAKVTEIRDATHMTVDLIPPLKSTYGDVSIIPTNADQTHHAYFNIECEYLDCHTAAFAVGDEVVVQYLEQNPDKPKVIGFRHHPQPCAALNFYTQTNDRLRVAHDENTWVRSPFDAPLFGDTYWIGEKRAVSWFGRKRRHWTRTQEDPNIAVPNESVTWVMSGGRKIATAPGPVLGAAIVETFLIVVCREAERVAAYAIPLTATEGAWQLLSSYATGFAVDPYSPAVPFPSNDTWIFSQSGKKAACCHHSGYGGPIFALVTLFLTVAGTTVQGAFTVANASLYTETSDVVDHSTCLPYPVRPSSCVGDVVSDVTRTYTNVAVDFVGEEMVLFDYIFAYHYEDQSTYGPPFEACHVGGNGLAEFASGSASGTETRRLVCPALDFDLRYVDRQWSSSFVSSSYAVPADNDFGCVPYMAEDRSASSTQKGFAIEHLNVSGGVGKVIVVGRTLDLVNTTATSILGGAFGPDVPGYPGHNTSTDTVSGRQTLELRVGSATTPYGEVLINNTVPDVFSYDEEAIILRDLFINAEPYTLAWVACDRAGHLLYSSPLFNVILGVPVLPGTVGNNNQTQFIPVGAG